MANTVNTVNLTDRLGGVADSSTQKTSSLSDHMRKAMQQHSAPLPTDKARSGKPPANSNDEENTDAKAGGLTFQFLMISVPMPEREDGRSWPRMPAYFVPMPLQGHASVPNPSNGAADSVSAPQNSPPPIEQALFQALQSAEASQPLLRDQKPWVDASTAAKPFDGKLAHTDTLDGSARMQASIANGDRLNEQKNLSFEPTFPSRGGNEETALPPLLASALEGGTRMQTSPHDGNAWDRQKSETDVAVAIAATTEQLDQLLTHATDTRSEPAAPPSIKTRPQEVADSGATTNELEYRFSSWDDQAAVDIKISDTSQSAPILTASNERVHHVLESSLTGNFSGSETPLLHLVHPDNDASRDRRGSASQKWNEEDQGETA